MKRFLCLLLCLLFLPLGALAWEMEYTDNRIRFPELDGIKLRFVKEERWTIVTAENYLEHMELLMARGDSEEEIHTRFARETLLWEAYVDWLPEDACIRLERFCDEASREVWHLKHLNTQERKEFLAAVNDGRVVREYDVYSAKYEGNGGTSYIEGSFTNWPPDVHESGVMQIHYRNGSEYVLTYAVRERLAGRSKLRSKAENERINDTPLGVLTFSSKLQPMLPSFALDEAFPTQVKLGETEITGTVKKGAKVKATLDGEEIKAKVSSSGKFTLVLPIETPGDHTVELTVTHSKNTPRVERYVLNASDHRTPLTLTQQPEEISLAGEQTVAGVTEPGAEVTIQLDEGMIAFLTADEKGEFSHSFEVLDGWAHVLSVTASSPGLDDCILNSVFAAQYETVKEGTKAFQKNLTEYSIGKMAEDPQSYVGERVKISVRVQELAFTPTGLGILCTYNPPSGSKHKKTPLYLDLYGYGQDQIYEGMIMTVYGTVSGQEEDRLAILVEYGTYLVNAK